MEEDLFIPLKKGEITAANAAALSGKLLQMANGAVYSDGGDEIVSMIRSWMPLKI